MNYFCRAIKLVPCFVFDKLKDDVSLAKDNTNTNTLLNLVLSIISTLTLTLTAVSSDI